MSAASSTPAPQGHALLLRLSALEDLRALKERYSAAADAKYLPDRRRQPRTRFARAAADQAACFTEDAVWDGGEFGGRIVGRRRLLEFFKTAPWRFAQHFYMAPELSIDGDVASGCWRLWQIGIREVDGRTVLLAGRTEEAYRRTPAGWLIARMQFLSLHMMALADEPDALRCLIPCKEGL